jgi:hypothetical protein
VGPPPFRQHLPWTCGFPTSSLGAVCAREKQKQGFSDSRITSAGLAEKMKCTGRKITGSTHHSITASPSYCEDVGTSKARPLRPTAPSYTGHVRPEFLTQEHTGTHLLVNACFPALDLGMSLPQGSRKFSKSYLPKIPTLQKRVCKPSYLGG